VTAWKDRHFIINLLNHIKMEKKQKMTWIFFIPQTNDSTNVFNVVNKIAQQIGYLNCEPQKDAALILCKNVVLSSEHRQTLTKLAEEYNYTLLYIIAEED
jgi:lipocalin